MTTIAGFEIVQMLQILKSSLSATFNCVIFFRGEIGFINTNNKCVANVHYQSDSDENAVSVHIGEDRTFDFIGGQVRVSANDLEYGDLKALQNCKTMMSALGISPWTQS